MSPVTRSKNTKPTTDSKLVNVKKAKAVNVSNLRTSKLRNISKTKLVKAENSQKDEQVKRSARIRKSKENVEEEVQKPTAKTTNINKKETNTIKRSKRLNESAKKPRNNLKQISLKEAFTNYTNKVENNKRLIKKYLSPNKTHCRVLARKLTVEQKKVPVYKKHSNVSSDSSVTCGSKVYEFNFDANDSMERIRKKRRKRTIKKAAVPKKKTVPKKLIVQENENKKVESNDALVKEKAPKSTDTVAKRTNTELGNVASKDVKSVDKAAKPSNIETVTLKEIQTKQTAETTEKDEKKLPVDNVIKAPTIVSVQDLGQKKVRLEENFVAPKNENFRPFRPTNIFKDRLTIHQKNTVNNSLFEKSLSPITRLSENFEISSPCRIPASLTFSQVRNAFQSTPQDKNPDKIHELKSQEIAGKVANTPLKANENRSPRKQLKKKSSLTSRKFGTEITNMDHSVQSSLGDEIDVQKSVEVENRQSNISLGNKINTSVNSFSSLHNTDNKFNSMNSSHTSKQIFSIMHMNRTRSPQKILGSIENIRKVPSPRKVLGSINVIGNQKENRDLEQGSSGAQKTGAIDGSKPVLRQLNLNNYLNIMDTPESTVLKTPHGIFDDIQSSPVSRIIKKKPVESNLDVNHAFGFDEENSTDSISPKKQDTAPNPEKINAKPFARISINEIKNHFLKPQVKKADTKPLKEVQNKIVTKKSSPVKSKLDLSKRLTAFYDTFDVQSEKGEISINNDHEVPLFADLEPSHFKEPPRYSYKRKYEANLSFSDGENEEEEKSEKRAIKRSKTSKTKNKEDKNFITWATNLNKTFSEIDEHELVIE